MTEQLNTRLTPQFENMPAHAATLTTVLDQTFIVSNLPGNAQIKLTYQPDKHVMTPAQFNEWLENAAQNDFGTWENCLNQLIDGAYDTLLPKEIRIQINIEHTDGGTQTLQAEQRQPDNSK